MALDSKHCKFYSNLTAIFFCFFFFGGYYLQGIINDYLGTDGVHLQTGRTVLKNWTHLLLIESA